MYILDSNFKNTSQYNQLKDISGIISLDFGFTQDKPYYAEFDSNNNIIICGTINNKISIIKLKSNGELDDIFSNDRSVITDINGVVSLNFSINSDEVPHSLCIDNEDNIIVVGQINNNLAIFKLNNNGQFVTTFGKNNSIIENVSNTSGLILLDFEFLSTESTELGHRVKTDNFNNIIVVGHTNANTTATSNDLVIIKLDQDGNFIGNFNNTYNKSSINGIIQLDIDNLEKAESYPLIHIDKEDNIIIGTKYDNTYGKILILKLESNGNYINTFGKDNNDYESSTEGVLIFKLSEYDILSDLITDQNNNIIGITMSRSNQKTHTSIFKLDSSGNYISTFGANNDKQGVIDLVLDNNSNVQETPNSLNLDTNDNIFVFGHAHNDLFIMKLDQEGNYDNNFINNKSDISGVMIFNIGHENQFSNDSARRVLLDKNNNVVMLAQHNGSFGQYSNIAITKLKYQSNAGSSGDPYVTTFSGHKYKIPNKYNIYRMFQLLKENEQITINASVSQLTNSEKQQLLKITNELGIKNPILNGYYYDKFYISYNDKYVVFDRNIKLIDTNIDTEDERLYIKYSDKIKDFSCPIQGTCKCKSTYIKLPNIDIELQNIYHLQIINGINVNYSGDIREVKGIFNTNKHPKNYVVKKIESEKIIKEEKGKEYKRQDKENWIRVK